VRYKSEVLNYLYKGKNIQNDLEMTVEEALNFFVNSEIKERLTIF